ncbi:MAG: ribosome biogenesis GTP-binding protein YihA/YsxC [bacterium]
MRKKAAPQAKILATSYLPDQLPPMRGAMAVFLGRSNAGKSSLLNEIFKKDLARVSKSPGKTRSVNFYQWGSNLTLIDVPGYGFARRSQTEREAWRTLMERFFDELPPGAFALLLLDSKRELQSEELDLIDALRERGLELELLLTKADRLNQGQREALRRAVEAGPVVAGQGIPLTWRFVSAKTGEGIDALRRRLFDYAKAIPISAPNHDPLRSRRRAGNRAP